MKGKGHMTWSREDLEKLKNRPPRSSRQSVRDLNPELFGGALPAGRAASGPEAEKGPSEPKQAPEPKKTGAEKEFEMILRREYPDCEIKFEAYTLVLAPGLRYTPDFAVEHPDGKLSFFEVKGAFLFKGATKSMTRATLTKPRTAAMLFPHRFHIAIRSRSGEWSREKLSGKADTIK